MSSIDDLLDGKRICVCAGSGGVGKTTTAAAIAMGMASRGLKVGVVTIDPARRLADSLGLTELGNEPRQVAAERFTEFGIPMEGELWAMMLDAKRTFDEVIETPAGDSATAREVLDNRVYRELSGAVAGSQEYTAMAKLFELDQEGLFDLLVLDTPPSRNALDFLDAPDRLTHFLEGRALRVLLAPTNVGFKFFGRGTSMVFSVLRKVTGAALMEDLSVFFRALSGMLDGFRERARRVDELMRDPATTFVVVTSPEREPMKEAIFFSRKLREGRLPFGALLVNRVRQDWLDGEQEADGVAAELADELGEDLAARVAENLSDLETLAQRDRRNISELAAEARGTPLLEVPLLPEDVHDVEGLVQVARFLFAGDEERAELAAEAN